MSGIPGQGQAKEMWTKSETSRTNNNNDDNCDNYKTLTYWISYDQKYFRIRKRL